MWLFFATILQLLDIGLCWRFPLSTESRVILYGISDCKFAWISSTLGTWPEPELRPYKCIILLCMRFTYSYGCYPHNIERWNFPFCKARLGTEVNQNYNRRYILRFCWKNMFQQNSDECGNSYKLFSQPSSRSRTQTSFGLITTSSVLNIV